MSELHSALTATIYRDRDIEQIVLAAGLAPGAIAWAHPPRTIWFEVINEAAGQSLLPTLIERTIERYPALGSRMSELRAEQPLLSAGAGDAALSSVDQRWKGFATDGTERRIVEGDETMLDIAFLARGVQRAAAVCRLTVSMVTGKYHGSGFRIGPSVLLTNHHVLFDWHDREQPAQTVTAEFGYEVDLQGRMRKDVLAVAADVTTITGVREHDFALIWTSAPMPADVPVLSLMPSRRTAVDDRVIIVQHPSGLPKKISLAHNLVRYADDDVVQYWTDTEAGSSGSPVFNEAWELVALHHQWVESPVDDGAVYRNQGRNIRRVADHIAGMGVDLR